jgi:CotH protein
VALVLFVPAGGATVRRGQADEAAWLFDPEQVTEIDLTSSALSRLDADPGKYVEASITLRHGGNVYGPYQVGLKLKGHATFRTLDGKAAFKIKFDYSVAGQRFGGLKGLTLNNMVQDPSMIAEATSALLAQAIGVPSARVGYAYVRVNGLEYGLYADVETVDSVMAQRWFASTRHIYEANYGGDVIPGRTGEFDVSEGSSSDRADLDALAAADAGGSEGWSKRIESVANLTELTRAWAEEHYMGQFDGYSFGVAPQQPNNYYLQSDEAGRFALITSGTDQTWVDRTPFGLYGKGVMMRHCVADATCRQLYIDALRRLAANPEVTALPARARQIRDAIAPWRARDPRREQSLGDGEVDASAKIAAVDERPAQLAAWLASPTFVDALTGAEAAPPPASAAAAPPTKVAVRPVIGKPATVPAALRAGKAATVVFKVARSDDGRPLLAGTMSCTPTIAGATIAHRERFKAGTVTLELTVPKAAKGKLLEMQLTIAYAGRTATRTSSFRIS